MARILFVSNMYPSKTYPWYGSFVKRTEDLLRTQFEIELVVLRKHPNVVIKMIAYVMFFLKIFLLGTTRRYDAVYANYASHVSLPIRLVKMVRPSMRIITNVHGNDVVPNNKKDEKLLGQTKKMLAISDMVVVPSEYFEAIVKTRFKVRESVIIVYPSGGINSRKYKKIDSLYAKKRLGLDEKKQYIGYVSRIDYKKGWDYFIKALEKVVKENTLNNYDFIIAGNGQEYEKMHKFVNESGMLSRIHLFKDANSSNLLFIYNAVDIFVFPTRLPSESLGLVGLEAMACERVVISSNKYGPSTYIDDGVNGFSVNTESVSEIAEKIVDISIMNEERKRKIGVEARATALQYESVICGDRLKEEIANVLKKKGKTCVK